MVEKTQLVISVKERNKIRDRKIRALYRTGLYSMDTLVLEMEKLGFDVSKTTVFFAVNGRSKKTDARKKARRETEKVLKGATPRRA